MAERDVIALVEKTSVKPGESLIARQPKRRGASVEILFSVGQSERETVEIPEGATPAVAIVARTEIRELCRARRW